MGEPEQQLPKLSPADREAVERLCLRILEKLHESMAGLIDRTANQTTPVMGSAIRAIDAQIEVIKSKSSFAGETTLLTDQEQKQLQTLMVRCREDHLAEVLYRAMCEKLRIHPKRDETRVWAELSRMIFVMGPTKVANIITETEEITSSEQPATNAPPASGGEGGKSV